MQDPLALAEQRLAAGELRPALDALKEARAQAYEAGDRDELERMRALALELQPAARRGQQGRLLLRRAAVRRPREPRAAPRGARSPGGAGARAERRPADEARAGPASEPDPSPSPNRSRPNPSRSPSPNLRTEPEPEPSRSRGPPAPEPVIGRSVVEAHIEEATTTVLEPGERLLGMFHGVVRETREDGERGRPKGGVALHDYLLVTDRGIVLWARGRAAASRATATPRSPGADTGSRRFSAAMSRSTSAATRRWFSSMRRGDDELAAELIRELAGPPAVTCATGSSTAAGSSGTRSAAASSTSPATSPAPRSSTSTATSRRRPGPAAAIRCPTAEDFAAAAGRAGIGPGVFVVAYGNMGGAERLWWLLRHFGHDDCAVLAAGSTRGSARSRPARRRSSRRRSSRVRARTTRSRPTSSPRGSATRLVVVDARLRERWLGEPNPIDSPPGRIPGALNAPWNEPLPELPAGEPVAYCGSGVTACVTLHRLALAGREGRLYPGGWSEWSQRGLPLERGEPGSD